MNLDNDASIYLYKDFCFDPKEFNDGYIARIKAEL